MMEILVYGLYDIWIEIKYRVRQILKIPSNCYVVLLLLLYVGKKFLKNGKLQITDAERIWAYNVFVYLYFLNKRGKIFKICYQKFLHIEGYKGSFTEALADLEEYRNYYRIMNKKKFARRMFVYKKYPDSVIDIVIKYRFVKMIGFVNYFLKGKRTRVFY